MEKTRKFSGRMLIRCCALLVVMGFLLAVPCASRVFADEVKKTTNRMNVMLVIDGSISLDMSYNPTDPDGYRYDAIDLFLALLTDQGNNVGAVVFHGSPDEFHLDHDIQELNGKDAKLELSRQIRRAPTDSGTNLGAALLRGVEEAQSMNEENGLQSVVILFSDGKTDVGSDTEATEASLQAKEDAIVMAQDAGIPVYTICLAATDYADPAELEEIATRTRGSAVVVENGRALSSAFETFYKMIFESYGTEIREMTFPEDGVISIPFTIPTFGAEEANIILDTTGLSQVMIHTPNGDMTDEQMEDATMSGGFYDVIKLVNPPAGDYLVTLQGVPKNKVTVNVLFNIDTSATLRAAGNKEAFTAGENVVLEANLIRDGQIVQDPSVTSEYTAVLHLTDLKTGATEDYPMTAGPDGTFTYTFSSNVDASYSATADLTCEALSLTTNSRSIYFDNTPPVASTDLIEVKKTVWPFFGRSHTLELSGYFTDAQDGTLSDYRLISSELVKDTVTLDEQTGTVVVNTGASKSGKVVFEAADSMGATARITVRYKITDVTLVVLIGTLVAIAVGAGVLIALWISINEKPWKGEIEVRNLISGTYRLHADFRGRLKLSKFAIGNCGVDGYFKAMGRNQVVFVSKKPVFTANPAQGARKQIQLAGGKVKIFKDKNMREGIEVSVKPQMTRNSGGFGGGAPRRSPVKNAPTSKNPFA